MLKWICLFILNLTLLYGQESSLFVTEDYQKAQRAAHEYELPMALVFTGSDWSTESEAFLSEWLFHSERPKELRHDLVFAWLDFPELNTKPINLVEQDYNLKKHFQVTNFPMIILLDAKGQEVTRLGYPFQEDFVSLIKERLFIYEHFEDKWTKAKEANDEKLILACFEDAQLLGNERFLNEIMAFATQNQICPPLLFEHYVNLVNEGKKNQAETRALRQYLLKSDPKNEKGIREGIALIDFQEQNNAFPLETILKQFGSHESENFWRIHLVLSEHFLDKGKSEEALEHAQASYRYAPSQKKEGVSDLIEQISMTTHVECP